MSENEKLGQAAGQVPDTAKAPGKPAKGDKKAKKDKAAKPSFSSRVRKWWREMKSELKKVQWPTSKQTINNTVIVIACCVVVGICIWLFDWLAQSIISALLALFQG